jgi:hypothetical protein
MRRRGGFSQRRRKLAADDLKQTTIGIRNAIKSGRETIGNAVSVLDGGGANRRRHGGYSTEKKAMLFNEGCIFSLFLLDKLVDEY